MSKKFYTADLHLGHGKVIEYCNRPFKDADDMNTQLVARWNGVVKKDDDVYVLGDIAFGKNTLKKWVSKLQGRIHLIIGNHDKTMLAKCKESLTDYFVEIVDYKEIKDGDITVCMSHYPLMEWNMKNYGSVHLHGHIHNRECEAQEYSRRTENMFNVGIDVNNFRLVTLAGLLREQEFNNKYGEQIKELESLDFDKYNKHSYLELLSLITYTILNDHNREYCFTENQFNKEWKRNLLRLVNTTDVSDNLYYGNEMEELLKVPLAESNSIVVEGYIVYDLCGHNADYDIITNLTKEQAYERFNYSKDNMFTTIIYVIKDNVILKKGGTMYDGVK